MEKPKDFHLQAFLLLFSVLACAFCCVAMLFYVLRILRGDAQGNYLPWMISNSLLFKAAINNV